MPRGVARVLGSRRVFMRLTLCFWTAAGLAGLVLGGSLRVLAEGSEPTWLSALRSEGGHGPARRYTPGALALGNLSAQVDGARAALPHQPTSIDLRGALVRHLLERARFTAAASDLDEALSLVTAMETADPSAEQLLLEAKTLAALHRFPEAQARLERAQQRGVPAAQVTHEQDTILLALGVAPGAAAPIVARRAAAARRRPSVGTLVDYAAALAAAGRLLEADEVLARAAGASPDVSPLPVAYVAFFRGVLAAEQRGAASEAEGHYREALRLVPGFVRAAVHLAELEAERGDVREARARLRSVLSAEDPEPASRLAQLSTGAERAALVSRARGGYDALLERHRAAYLDHALEFALAHEPPGAEHTAALARELLASRPNARAHQLAIEAAEAGGDHAAACALASRAQALAAAHPVLAAQRVALGCS